MSVEQRRFLESIEYEGNYEFILEMLKTSANTLNLKGECGTIAMILACHFGHTKCAEVLLLAPFALMPPLEQPGTQLRLPFALGQMLALAGPLLLLMMKLTHPLGHRHHMRCPP